MRILNISGVTGCLLILLTSNSIASVIVNGDFSDPTDFAGFDVFGSKIVEVHDLTTPNDFAQLETDGTFQRTLQQTFTVPAGPTTLLFDFAFSTDAVPPLGIIPDSLAASYITTADGDILDILVVDYYGAIADPSDGISGFTPIDVALDSSVTISGFTSLSGGATFSGRVSVELPAAVLGEEATLFFDLFDQGDGAKSIAAIDNISAIPEPLSIVVWIGVFGAGFGVYRFGVSKRKKPETS